MTRPLQKPVDTAKTRDTTPRFKANSFKCPHCEHLTNQTWEALKVKRERRNVDEAEFGPFTIDSHLLWVSTCRNCHSSLLWLGEQIIFPTASRMPVPEADMPPESLALYKEAQSVFDASPKSAAALLRLALERVLVHLGENPSLNVGIKSLVKKGLIDEDTQKAMDVLRLIGNSAVHAGFIDLSENRKTAASLFDMLNHIVVETITRKKRVRKLFESLPDAKKAEIDKRDGKS